MPLSSFSRRLGTSSPHWQTADREMPNWSPITCIVPNTATRSLVFMYRELSTLRTSPSRALNGDLVNLAYMPGTTLRERLIEIADDREVVRNDSHFAAIAKVSRSAVSQWRAGDVKALKALSAVNIQEETGYSARWLILNKGPKKLSGKPDLTETKRRLTPPYEHKLLVLIRSFLDTDDDGREQIVSAVNAVTGNGSSGHQERRSRSSKRR